MCDLDLVCRRYLSFEPDAATPAATHAAGMEVLVGLGRVVALCYLHILFAPDSLT
jgi:hypothetical protein